MKDIPGFEKRYAITTNGQVWSYPKQTNAQRNGKWLTPTANKSGYLFVYLVHDGQRIYSQVHRLVAATYLPNPNDLPQVNHKDGNKQNNDISNLEWCSARDNVLHSTRILKKNIGELQGGSILTNKQVQFIKQHPVYFGSQSQLAKEFDVSVTTIHCIVRDKTWRFQ